MDDCSVIEQFKDDSTNWCVEECPEIALMFPQQSTNSCVLACQDVSYFAYFDNRTCLMDCPEPYFEDRSTSRCVEECPLHEGTFADEFLRECVTDCQNHTLMGDTNETTFYADVSTLRCVAECPEYP